MAENNGANNAHELISGADVGKNIILKDIIKIYDGKKVIDGFSSVFSAGTTTVIMGLSGSGKSTLLHIAAGLIKPDSGSVYRQQNVKTSFVFQDNRLLDWYTATENITVLGVYRETAFEALGRMGLADAFDKRPSELSGGMRRRLALARAIAHDGEFFFIDEALQGLDAKTADSVLEELKKTLSGKTAVVVTHSEREAELLSDRIIRL